MNCREVARLLPGYLDGAIKPREHDRLREHLISCEACRDDLERYRRMAVCLARVEPVAPPVDLATRIRVQVAQANGPRNVAHYLWARAVLVFHNILQPVAIPATGGILAALVVFVFFVQSVLVGVPLGGVVPNDLPINLVQPARLESLAPFPVPGLSSAGNMSGAQVLLLEATLNAQGQVVSYKILSGPSGPAVQHQIDQVLLFSRFRPQWSFGRPTSGGRVLLSFSEVRVRG